MNVSITLPDGTVVKRSAGVTAADVAASIGPALARDAVAARVDGVLMDLNVPLEHGARLEIVTVTTPKGLEILRHSTSHIMACAVGRLYEGVRFGIGPAIEEGFYYDFDLPEAISVDDLERIEEEMGRIASEGVPFEREDLSPDEAREAMREAGQDYKVEHIDDLVAADKAGVLSFYRTGEFVDMCRGPHIPDAGRARAFKLLSVAGAYWRGDSSRPQLQRIYGTAFVDEKQIEEFLHRREEAEKRDHRRIGKDLDLFSADAELGQGLILWHPRGATIRRAVEECWLKVHGERGYQPVYTPHIASEAIYRRSGHIPKYEDMMYAPLEVDGQPYRVKPMNCPGHIKIFQSHMRSYRDLPIRYAELGTVYRYEPSGSLHGMLRVRGFTQDDAHIFCTPEQLVAEVAGVLELIDEMMAGFGYRYKLYLATRPGVSLETATDEEWERATESLRLAMEARGEGYEVDEGGGVFYAPKIDAKVVDAIGREWQGPTIQVDLNLPKCFGVTYIAEDGAAHECIIVHRTVLGSMERFVGGLIEHFAGWFPLWLAPEQVRVLPITDAHHAWAHEVTAALREAGVRASCDERNEKTGYKVHTGTADKVPYLLIVGAREVEGSTVSVRSHGAGDEGAVPLAEFVERVVGEIGRKELPQGFENA
ncbi:MAG: threonine--tRNA ligase [Candidatus Brocadiia bacterium]|jgi:threonyl-tRNA synthetase|nr:threonine--tRNA ligase [Candidatus Brocadiia bacterium]